MLVWVTFVNDICVITVSEENTTKTPEDTVLYALKCGKTYHYIPALQERIVKRRITSEVGMPRRRTLRLDDPRRLGVVPPLPPPAISELVQMQVSRGVGM